MLILMIGVFYMYSNEVLLWNYFVLVIRILILESNKILEFVLFNLFILDKEVEVL